MNILALFLYSCIDDVIYLVATTKLGRMIDQHAQTLPCKWLSWSQLLHVTDINGFIPTSANHATIINGFICTYVSPKITKLGRIADWYALTLPCNLTTTRRVFNAVIKSHFNYCSLVWMFGSRRSNNLINQKVSKNSLQ